MEKYEKDGKIAVLISSGYGAGWSTWDSNPEFLAMDKTLVQMAMDKASAKKVEAYLKTKGRGGTYMGGWPVYIEWVDKGSQFRIDEYDGFERLITQDSEEFLFTA